MGFFDKIGDSLAAVLRTPADLVKGGLQIGQDAVGVAGQATRAGFMDGNIGFGSRRTGDVGAFMQRSGPLITIALIIVGVVLLASTLKKKKVGKRRSRKRKPYSQMTRSEKASYNLAKARRVKAKKAKKGK